ENQSEQQRRTFTFEFAPQIADHTEYGHDVNIKHVVVQRIHADRAEQDNGREQDAVGYLEQFDPQADERQVQNHQHQVADPHGSDQTPEQFGVAGHDLWS